MRFTLCALHFTSASLFCVWSCVCVRLRRVCLRCACCVSASLRLGELPTLIATITCCRQPPVHIESKYVALTQLLDGDRRMEDDLPGIADQWPKLQASANIEDNMKVARTIEGMGKRNSLPPRGPLLEQLETELPKIIDRIREAVGAGQAPPRPALGPAPVDLGPAPTDHLLAEQQLQQQQQLVKPRQTAAARAAAAAARAAARKKADDEEAAGLAKVRELLANPSMVLSVEEQIMILLACVAHGRRQAEAARDKAAIGTTPGRSICCATPAISILTISRVVSHAFPFSPIRDDHLISWVCQL